MKIRFPRERKQILKERILRPGNLGRYLAECECSHIIYLLRGRERLTKNVDISLSYSSILQCRQS